VESTESEDWSAPAGGVAIILVAVGLGIAVLRSYAQYLSLFSLTRCEQFFVVRLSFILTLMARDPWCLLLFGSLLIPVCRNIHRWLRRRCVDERGRAVAGALVGAGIGIGISGLLAILWFGYAGATAFLCTFGARGS
jgi:hypothetical protein